MLIYYKFFVIKMQYSFLKKVFTKKKVYGNINLSKRDTYTKILKN